uniref:Uncharacterized protein n=1 Tax=Lygus hesperus TaxID=30085 RepID=A0A0A9WUF7_LYGHE
MKTSSQNPPTNRSEELKHCENHNNRNAGSGQKNSVEGIPLPSTSGDGTKDAEADGPSQVLAWVADASKEFTPKLASPDIKELENMISLYLAKVSSCISKCYVPNRAAKMKRCMNDVLMFFNFLYQEISEDKKTYSTYLDKMAELMAYYIDMEIQASSRAKENPLVIASKLTSSLFIFLDKSHDHILDSILKANNINKNFWELCSLIFSGVLKDTPNKIMSELTYVRYILAYKMWKRVVQGPDERKRVMSLASLRLKTPPQFVEKIRAGLLNGIIPKVPKKRCDVTTFLIQAKFDVKEKAKAFLKYISESKTNVMFVPAIPAIKTDIPLLVGYLPDFGPSLSLVKLDPPALEEENQRGKVDISGSRLMNELWTSVNHEASFREAIRMQNVTTFNKVDTRVVEKKKIHCVLKHKKVVRVLPRDNNVIGSKNSVDSQQADSQDVTIVLSDDSDKGHAEPVKVPRKSKLARFSRSPALGQSVPVVRLKQERLSPTRTEPTPEVPPPPKEVIFPIEVPIPQVVPKRPMMTPIQIKREIIDNDDCIIMESPEPPVPTEPEPVPENTEVPGLDHGGSVELEMAVSLKKADVGQPNSPYVAPISDKFTKDVIVTDKPCGLKEEKVLESPTKEKEINIRRDLFNKIKYPHECGQELTTDVPPKSLEPLSETDKVCVSVDNGKDESMAASPGAKSDNVLFDDEESSWSPSGSSQELIRNVVDTFISHYSPADDGETRLSSNNVTADSPLEANLVENNMPSCELFSEDGSPPAKRLRIDDLPSNPEDQVEEVVVEQKSTGGIISPEKPEEQPSKPNEDEEFPDPVLRAVHNNTCRWDHVVFVLQTKLRDVLPTNITTPIPSPVEIDPDTGRPVERCSCNQCVGNFKALVFNHKALVGFQNDVLKASRESEGEEVATNSAVASTTDQVEPKQEDDNLEHDDDGNGAAESGPQLPFKKRKALVSSEKDDGASPQYSDTSKDGLPSDYPSTPMLSIALLASSANSYASPPLPDTSVYSSMPPLVSGAETSYTSSVSGATNFSPTAMPSGYCSSGLSAQLGFPSAQPEAGFPYIASTETLNPASLPGGSSYNPTPSRMEQSISTGFEGSYNSAFPGGGFPSNPSHDLRSGYGSSTSRPPGGGFPPFSAVVPPLTNFPGNAARLQTHTVDTHHQVTEKPSRRATTARRFVTPAQLKQAFIAKDARSCSEASSYSEPVSHSRKHSSSTTEPRSSRAKKEPSTSSRKSGRSSRKKK